MLLILTNKKRASEKIQESIHLIGKYLHADGIPFSVASFHDIELFLEKDTARITVSGEAIEQFSTIFPRKVGRSNEGLAFILADHAKKRGACFIDQFHGETHSRTKLIQMYLFALHGLIIPKTYYSATYSEAHLRNALAFISLPLIIKQCKTSKGAGVFLVHTEQELREKIDALLSASPSQEIILQEFIPNTFEYRILVTGDQIGSAEKKIRTDDSEFRNNVHLGAREEFIPKENIPLPIQEAALLASHIANVQVAGVDIVETATGEPIVFEVNSCPAFTLDESISPEIQSLAHYLISCEKNS